MCGPERYVKILSADLWHLMQTCASFFQKLRCLLFGNIILTVFRQLSFLRAAASPAVCGIGTWQIAQKACKIITLNFDDSLQDGAGAGGSCCCDGNVVNTLRWCTYWK